MTYTFSMCLFPDRFIPTSTVGHVDNTSRQQPEKSDKYFSDCCLKLFVHSQIM